MPPQADCRVKEKHSSKLFNMIDTCNAKVSTLRWFFHHLTSISMFIIPQITAEIQQSNVSYERLYGIAFRMRNDDTLPSSLRAAKCGDVESFYSQLFLTHLRTSSYHYLSRYICLIHSICFLSVGYWLSNDMQADKTDCNSSFLLIYSFKSLEP